MKKLIVIEGLDKVGKTTLLNKLKQSWFAEKSVFFNFPSSDFQYLRDLTKDFENTTPYIRDLAHALSHGLTYLEIEKIKNFVDYIICDRYFYSSWVYSDWERMSMIEYKWMDPVPPIPDVFVYMYSNKGYPDFANTRDNQDPNDSMSLEKRNEFHKKYLDVCNLLKFDDTCKVYELCVDLKTPNDVYHEVLRTIF